MAFVVIDDACVLYPNVVRDMLIRVAIEGTVRAHWTAEILEEVFEDLKSNRPDLSPEQLNRTRRLMNAVLPDALVTGYQSLIEGLELPDPNDRHVVAAAIKAGAQLIVTSNLKDFPASHLGPIGLEAKGPDDFLVDQFYLSATAVRGAVRDIAKSRKKSVTSEEDICRELEKSGIVQLGSLLRANG